MLCGDLSASELDEHRKDQMPSLMWVVIVSKGAY
jgi:hypothetical protein